MNTLSLQQSRGMAAEPVRERGGALPVAVALLFVSIAGLGYLGFQAWQRLAAMERQLAELGRKADESAALAREARQRATAAEEASRAAAEGRMIAEAQTDEARFEATSARDAEARAKAEADAIRKKAEAEVGRLEAALGQIAETRRTALGLVMNLGSDHLKFEFDKADLRPQDKELLSRVAGILMTSHDYTISVNGHTDDVGSDAYNQKLSERRAQSVRDYLVQAGLPAEILSVEGHGKSLPLVKGTSEAARARNRRVELGLVNTQIRYGR